MILRLRQRIFSKARSVYLFLKVSELKLSRHIKNPFIQQFWFAHKILVLMQIIIVYTLWAFRQINVIMRSTMRLLFLRKPKKHELLRDHSNRINSIYDELKKAQAQRTGGCE